VRWKGYTAEDDLTFPASHLTGAKDLLEAYRLRQDIMDDNVRRDRELHELRATDTQSF